MLKLLFFNQNILLGMLLFLLLIPNICLGDEVRCYFGASIGNPIIYENVKFAMNSATNWADHTIFSFEYQGKRYAVGVNNCVAIKDNSQ